MPDWISDKYDWWFRCYVLYNKYSGHLYMLILKQITQTEYSTKTQATDRHSIQLWLPRSSLLWVKILHISSKFKKISFITLMQMSTKYTHRDYVYYIQFQTQDNQDLILQLVAICDNKSQRSIITSSMCLNQFGWNSWFNQYIYAHVRIPNQHNDHIYIMTDRMHFSENRCHSFGIPQIAGTPALSNHSPTDNIM